MADELQKYLDSLEAEHPYRIERVLGHSAFEETQLVYRVCEKASEGVSESVSDAASGGLSDAVSEGVSGVAPGSSSGAVSSVATGAISKSSSEATSGSPVRSLASVEEGPLVRKLIRISSAGEQVYECLFRAQQEGRRFEHLPAIEECRREGDRLVVVYGYVPGQPLSSLVADLGASVGLAKWVFPQLCEAVSELHESLGAPVIHRDLKPSNILISKGKVFLIDLGIARLYKEGVEQDTQCFGTRSYAPPEQFGFGQTSVRSDVYALGMVLYFCLTGNQPPSSMSDSTRPEGVPAPLWDVILTATKFDPEQRFSSVAALKAAAEWALGASDDGARASQDSDQTRLSARMPEQPRPQWPLWKRALSKTWNILLACGAGLLWFGLFASMAHPDVPETPFHAFVRCIEGIGFLTAPASLLAYGLADLRRSTKLPFADRSWLSRFGLMFKIALVVFLLTTLVSYALSPTA